MRAVTPYKARIMQRSRCTLRANRMPVVRCLSQAVEPLRSLPKTCNRLVARRTGSSFAAVAEVQEIPLPEPGPGEVLVRVHYAGINGGCETFRARGEHSFSGNQGKASFPLGAEGCGVVVALGPGVRNLQMGQAVACNGAAAFSEYVAASAKLCQPVQQAGPQEVALVLSAVTACAALEATAHIQAGETVLVTAAAGGTGQFAVQLAKLAGCHVIAVCGSETKAAVARQLGADHVIDYKCQDVQVELSRRYPGGVDVVYEGVGGQLQAALLPHLAPGGRLLQVGYISEYPHAGGSPGPLAALSAAEQQQWSSTVPEATNADLFWKGAELTGPEGRRLIGQIWPKDLLAIRRCRKRVFQLYDQGRLQVVVDQGRAFQGVASIPAAVEYMLQGGHTGKVVVKVQ